MTLAEIKFVKPRNRTPKYDNNNSKQLYNNNNEKMLKLKFIKSNFINFLIWNNICLLIITVCLRYTGDIRY